MTATFSLFLREVPASPRNDNISCQSEEFQLPPSYQTFSDPAHAGGIHAQPQDLGQANFLKSLVNAWVSCLDYFIMRAGGATAYQFTSGFCPRTLWVQGEAAVGLGMTYHKVSEIMRVSPLPST